MNAKLLLIIAVLGILHVCTGQQHDSVGKQTQSLGKYWFVMYSQGSNLVRDSASKMKISREHIDYIISLRKAGKIVTGGVFLDKMTWTGCEIFNCETKEEVLKIMEADPMVLSKIFSYEIHPWMTLKGVVTFG